MFLQQSEKSRSSVKARFTTSLQTHFNQVLVGRYEHSEGPTVLQARSELVGQHRDHVVQVPFQLGVSVVEVNQGLNAENQQTLQEARSQCET